LLGNYRGIILLFLLLKLANILFQFVISILCCLLLDILFLTLFSGKLIFLWNNILLDFINPLINYFTILIFLCFNKIINLLRQIILLCLSLIVNRLN